MRLNGSLNMSELDRNILVIKNRKQKEIFKHFLRVNNRKKHPTFRDFERAGYAIVDLYLKKHSWWMKNVSLMYNWCDTNIGPGRWVESYFAFVFLNLEDAAWFKMYWDNAE